MSLSERLGAFVASAGNRLLTIVCENRALVTVSEFRAGESTTKSLIPQGREIVTVTEGSLRASSNGAFTHTLTRAAHGPGLLTGRDLEPRA